MSHVTYQASAYLQHEATVSILPPLDGMLLHCRVTVSIKLVSTHLYTWVERGIRE